MSNTDFYQIVKCLTGIRDGNIRVLKIEGINIEDELIFI